MVRGILSLNDVTGEMGEGLQNDGHSNSFATFGLHTDSSSAQLVPSHSTLLSALYLRKSIVVLHFPCPLYYWGFQCHNPTKGRLTGKEKRSIPSVGIMIHLRINGAFYESNRRA